MKKKILITLTAAGVVALGGGTTMAMADGGADDRSAQSQTVKTDLTLDQAIAKAQEVVKGTVGSVELEDHGSAWEVELLAEDGTWHEVKIGADGQASEKTDDKADKADDDKAEADALKAAKTSASQAASAATGSVAGTVTSVELEDDGDQPAWEVEVRDAKGAEHEVLVGTADGNIISSRVEDHSEKGDDSKKDDDAEHGSKHEDGTKKGDDSEHGEDD